MAFQLEFTTQLVIAVVLCFMIADYHQSFSQTQRQKERKAIKCLKAETKESRLKVHLSKRMQRKHFCNKRYKRKWIYALRLR